MDSARAARLRMSGDMRYKRATGASFPRIRLNKEAIELHIAIFARERRCKTKHAAIRRLNNNHLPARDLFNGKRDLIEVLHQHGPIAFIGKRSAHLQRDKRGVFFDTREANVNRRRHRNALMA